MRQMYLTLALGVLILGKATGGWAMIDTDIPASAPNDAVMASQDEIRHVADWASHAFAGVTPGGNDAPISIEVRRQDFNVLRFAQSCMETPIKIGAQEYAHGLGTHANSELVVTLPKGATQFKAFVGIDNNKDTQGKDGSVEFIVEIDGKEAMRTPTLHGGDAPFPISVAIPPDAKQLLLKVGTTPDGPGHDQADWADAQLVLSDGGIRFLDDRQPNLLLSQGAEPFSFQYDGKPSSEFLKIWERTIDTKDHDAYTETTVTWSDPKTKLVVTATVKAYKKYPAVDWVLSFENRGASDTPIIENIQAMDVKLRTGHSSKPATIRHNQGDVCSERSFMPLDTTLESGKKFRMAPQAGRSSNGAFPFFNVQYGSDNLITAIGWTGQWAATLDREPTGPTRLQAGMELTHLLLHPGERMRTPRVLLLHSNGDTQLAHNRFRRLMLFEYVPKRDGRPVRLPIVSQCFDRYSWTRPDWATEAGQISAAKFAHDVGFDAHWLDAAWFVGGFPNGVGNWYCKPKEFPNGLKPVTDACHANGMKFVLWFEPERVAKDTQIAREHPEFIYGGAEGGLFKLNDPAAQRWLTDILSKDIGDYGLDVYRNDFNIDPLEFWRKNDAPDRQGMTEIRYIEGLYAMWDEFLAKHPGLMIDNCASGGRRIDLEMCMRSIPFWRSDTNCSPGHAGWNQAHTLGISQYVPLHMACAWTPDSYDVRSAATAGLICQWSYLDADFPHDTGKASLAEVKENQKYWYGDLYPLVSAGPDSGLWSAYQFHRADLDEGFVLVFRRKESRYTGVSAGLHALVPERSYAVTLIDANHAPTAKTMLGRELMTEMEWRIPDKGASMLVRYAGAKK
ncbi:MAG: alpha-galactosidase [Candidatus Hydrogenedentes bacterium]|nr:alpha-galactosidase [Candidatus Hydrogenedentota bacterium]